MTMTWGTDADMTPQAAEAEHARQDAVRWAVRDAVLAQPGITNTELFARFGPSAVKRLNDLRKHHGYDYAREHVGGHVWRYRFTVAPPQPGTPGYLASLPVVNPDHVVLVDPTAAPVTDGRLF